MSALDKEIEEGLQEAYGPIHTWRYCFTCSKMQKHELQIIVGIAEDVCMVCQNDNSDRPAIFRLKERPR